MNDQSKKATVAEIYATLNQLVDSYVDVMRTFSSIVGDMVEMKEDVREIEKFVNEQFADAITGRNLWQANARIHKATAEDLRLQLEVLTDEGYRIEAVVPVAKKVKK